MTTHDEALRDKLDACLRILANDPGPLDPDDPRNVHDLHGSEAEDDVLALKRACERIEGSAMFYFTGQRGTGKSTELKRLAVLLSNNESKAFVVDALDYISDTHLIRLADLILVVALAFAERILEETGEEFLKDGVATRFVAWLDTEIEFKEFTLPSVKVAFKERQNSLMARIHGFDPARQEKFIAECRDFITELSRFARQRLKRERIVLIVDSLERLRGVGALATDMFDRIVDVFDGNMEKLRVPELQLIFSVPPYLPYLANVRNMVRVFSLASVRVWQPPGSGQRRMRREEGVAVMRKVLNKRYAHWEHLIQPDALDELSLQSGGDLRQLLLRLLTEALDQGYFALDRLPLAKDDPIIKTVVARQQGEFRSLVAQNEYAMLKSIGMSNLAELPDRADLPDIARFFDTRIILNYRNGVDWVDLNPMLWPLIDAYQPAPTPGPKTNANA